MSARLQESSPSSRRGWLGVAAITASLFVFLTTELMPVGLLTPLSEDLDISVGVAGLMVTAQGSRPVSAYRSSSPGPDGSTGARC
ncbi:hypothetical protein [Streptomyces tendae]|uniref:hypothetical protein n=1 Tax=Streptomyces tendae TaxID=1932 RepID=UPI0037233224